MSNSKKVFYGLIAALYFAAIILTGFFVSSDADYGYAYAESEAESVYLGGIPIGIHATSECFVVTEIIAVTTKDGAYSPALQAGIYRGDLIVAVNGKKLNGIAELNEEIQNSETVTLTIKRGADTVNINVVPVFDVAQNAKKTGMLVKNDISGMGTLTFITKDKKFGALGHMITDEYGNGDIYTSGNIYDCEVTGYNRPADNAPGELRATVDFAKVEGKFSVNNIAGIYGETTIDTAAFTEIELSKRSEVRAGKAQILSTIEGREPKLYDIEIIRAIKQNEIADKSLVIRVTDKSLKNSTGGILQGMSGSPIIQNGKLVGAVTHVFMNDPTKGYGIYAEWMLRNAV